MQQFPELHLIRKATKSKQSVFDSHEPVRTLTLGFQLNQRRGRVY